MEAIREEKKRFLVYYILDVYYSLNRMNELHEHAMTKKTSIKWKSLHPTDLISYLSFTKYKWPS